MIYVNEYDRRYKAGDNGFALIESYPDRWEQTDKPNAELESMRPDGEQKPKRRTKKEGS